MRIIFYEAPLPPSCGNLSLVPQIQLEQMQRVGLLRICISAPFGDDVIALSPLGGSSTVPSLSRKFRLHEPTWAPSLPPCNSPWFMLQERTPRKDFDVLSFRACQKVSFTRDSDRLRQMHRQSSTEVQKMHSFSMQGCPWHSLCSTSVLLVCLCECCISIFLYYFSAVVQVGWDYNISVSESEQLSAQN